MPPEDPYKRKAKNVMFVRKHLKSGTYCSIISVHNLKKAIAQSIGP